MGKVSRLGLLLRLWWTQKRRQFRWADVFAGAYFAFLFLMIGGIVYMEMSDQIGEMKGQPVMGSVLIIISASLLISDLFFKFMFMNDSVLMDDFLKTKPVSKRDWNRFILISSFAQGWNFMLPLIVGVFAFLIVPVPEALVAILMAFVMSAMNSMLMACIRKSDGWELKLPMFLALFFYIVFAFVYSINIMQWSAALLMAVMTLLTLVGIYTLYIYFSHLVRYDEHKARTSRVHNLGEVSLFSMEYVSVLRSKRLRTMLIVLPLCFLPQLYFSNMMDDASFCFIPPLMVIFMGSACLGQWVFGVEANFFQGLWTKPLSIETMLRNKYKFYAFINLMCSLLVVPAIWLSNLDPFIILACWVFSAGMGNLMMMPTCLVSTRIDLFSSAFFNYQGANKGVNIYGLLLFIPFLIAGVGGWLMGVTRTCILFCCLGLLGFAVHRWVLHRLAEAYRNRRYKRFEKYME